ncbi:ankyrin repeat domain-containing protein [Pseudochryseolinea flava]|uniref:Ankyrin repeat domain-containing protein n=1 Tax=Pseudochryseolinea flava TaxID=2059302 RepID=A0A364XUC7_9BACT|nr:ankyrin repeat domain-containing protein [Pseudochryseolinea flava]RAV97917.1 hypothetical protein DQQ10_25935 [Pseudochryseolinea flava]
MSKEKELLEAIKDVNVTLVAKLIEENADVNYIDDDKASYGLTWPLLHHCIFKASSPRKKGHTEIATLLLANGADIEGVNHMGETPALFSIKYFAPEILELLIQKGANIHTVSRQGKNGNTAFDIILDRYYYDQKLDLDHIDDEESEAAKEAIRKGEGSSLTAMYARIDALVKAGYDLEAGEYSAALCTMFEIEQKKIPTKALSYLFNKGADPRAYVTLGEHRIPLFAYACHIDLPVELLEDMATRIGLNYVFNEYDDNEPLTIAIMNDNLALVKKLIERGANVRAQEERPLLQACATGSLKIVEYLVEHGADVHYLDKTGKKIIDFAEQNNFPAAVVEYLKSK